MTHDTLHQPPVFEGSQFLANPHSTGEAMWPDAPIFVTGMPRSGTTLLQHLLSQHPRIAIHGQEPHGIHWGNWLNALIDGLDAVQHSNATLDYAVPHYAGRLDPERTRREFLTFIRHYLIGDESRPRWGLKSLTACRIAAGHIAQVWPLARWVVCIREPFRCIESLRNTFDPEQQYSVDELCDWWTDAARFGTTHPHARLVQIDRLTTPSVRQVWVRSLFAFLEEEIVPEVEQFAADWPRIHEAIPAAQRTYRLTPEEREETLNGHPEFAEWYYRLGYDEPAFGLTPACSLGDPCHA